MTFSFGICVCRILNNKILTIHKAASPTPQLDGPNCIWKMLIYLIILSCDAVILPVVSQCMDPRHPFTRQVHILSYIAEYETEWKPVTMRDYF